MPQPEESPSEAEIKAISADDKEFRTFVIVRLIRLNAKYDQAMNDLKWIKRLVNPVTVVTGMGVFLTLVVAIVEVVVHHH